MIKVMPKMIMKAVKMASRPACASCQNTFKFYRDNKDSTGLKWIRNIRKSSHTVDKKFYEAIVDLRLIYF